MKENYNAAYFLNQAWKPNITMTDTFQGHRDYPEAYSYMFKVKQSDPNGLDAKTPGAKLDYGKPPLYRGLLDYFPRACMSIADVSAKGASKYSWKGWEKVEDGQNRYMDAMLRHVAKESVEGPIDLETGCYHLSQVAWNALATLELFLKELEESNVQ